MRFRVWATKTLKDHLVQGYTINEKRLLDAKEKFAELQNALVALALLTATSDPRDKEVIIKIIVNLLK